MICSLRTISCQLDNLYIFILSHKGAILYSVFARKYPLFCIYLIKVIGIITLKIFCCTAFYFHQYTVHCILTDASNLIHIGIDTISDSELLESPFDMASTPPAAKVFSTLEELMQGHKPFYGWFIMENPVMHELI